MIAEALPLLEDAIRDQRPVCLDYTDEHGEETSRVIEPHAVEETSARRMIVRAWDRLRPGYRSFRLDRIRAIGLLDSGETFRAPVRGIPEPPVTLVRYHGSVAEYSGQVMRLLGICGCHRCARLGVRYRIAEPGTHTMAAQCVRPTSLSPISEEEAAAYLVEHEALHAIEDALARIRAEIAEVDQYFHDGDAAHWTPPED